jgi:DNA-binding transcriptional MocR family regulator
MKGEDPRSSRVSVSRSALRSKYSVARLACYFAVTLPKGFDDLEIAARGVQKNLCLWPLSPNYLKEPARQGLILGFGNTSAEDMPATVRKLRDVLNQCKQ